MNESPLETPIDLGIFGIFIVRRSNFAHCHHSWVRTRDLWVVNLTLYQLSQTIDDEMGSSNNLEMSNLTTNKANLFQSPTNKALQMQPYQILAGTNFLCFLKHYK